MKIVLKCSCGKVLRLPMNYAGKYGQCPQCGKLNIIPKLTEEESAAPVNICSCPTCGSYLSDAEEICVSCRTNLKTGEWRSQDIKKRFVMLQKKSFWFCVSYVVLLAIIFFLWYRLQVYKNIYRTVESYKQIPQNSPEEIEVKLKAWEKIKQQFSILYPAKVEEQNIVLEKRLQEYYYNKNISEVMNKADSPVLERIISFTKVNLHYQISPIQWEEKIKTDFQLYLNSYQTKVDQLLQEQRYEEVVTRVTPQLLEEIMNSLFSISEAPESIKNAASSLLYEYKDSKNISLDKEKSEEKIRKCEEDFYLYLPQFYELIRNREYEEGQEKLQKFWNDVNSLNYFETENAFIKDVRSKINDMQAIRNLLHLANQGAEHSKGVNKKFVLITGDKVGGSIERYENNTFLIEDDQQRIRNIKLLDLSATDIIFFAFRANKHYSTYLYASVFLAYEDLPTHASKALEIASKKGASPQEILFYEDWLKKHTSK